MKYISLTQGKRAIVDDEDFEWLSKYSWQVNNGYAKRDVRCIRMHREILHAPKGLEVDHINGNRLDNRKSNLRLVNRYQQNQNSVKRKDNSSGYKGVNYFKPRGTWMARIQVNGKRIGLGTYHKKIDAVRAYIKASKKYFGEYERKLFDT